VGAGGAPAGAAGLLLYVGRYPGESPSPGRRYFRPAAALREEPCDEIKEENWVQEDVVIAEEQED